MYLLAALFVIVSGLVNAVWNLFAKKSVHKDVFLGMIFVLPSIALTPYLIMELWTVQLPLRAYFLMATSLLIQCCYGLLLSRTYMLGDLSLTYPIMRGTGTLLIPVISVMFLGESMSFTAWVGITTIIIGIFLLSGWNPFKRTNVSLKPVVSALGIGICITAYVLVDKITLAYISPLLLLQISNLGFLFAMLPGLFRWNKVITEWRLNWPLILIGSIISPGSYLLYLLAMKMGPISQLAPIREIGTVFATWLGIMILKESPVLKRVLLSAVILTGILLVGFGG